MNGDHQCVELVESFLFDYLFASIRFHITELHHLLAGGRKKTICYSTVACVPSPLPRAAHRVPHPKKKEEEGGGEV
jgi:hypothetical protein